MVDYYVLHGKSNVVDRGWDGEIRNVQKFLKSDDYDDYLCARFDHCVLSIVLDFTNLLFL